MPSAFIPSRLGYSAMLLVKQQIHQRSVHPGPLVLRTAPLKYPTPTPDRDRTVSRRSEPSSRTALMGEQPNPWNLLQLQEVGGQAVLGRQKLLTTPWPTERHGNEPTWIGTELSHDVLNPARVPL